MPLKEWAGIGNYYKKEERIADLGCGPSDILRYLEKNRKPEFYLGIDISDRYLKHARSKAMELQLKAEFLIINLDQLKDDPAVRAKLKEVLNFYKITTVNLFGVIHHLDDISVLATLNTVFEADSVKSLNSQDVLFIEGNSINNFYASLDRGDFVRSELEYDELLRKSRWKNFDKIRTKAGVSRVNYLHYKLTKGD
jgi:SAM-dependent methyltransferase